MIDQEAVQAVIDGDLARLRARLKAGIDPDGRDRYRGYRLLHVAAQERSIEACRLLLAAGADPNAPDRYGNGPLWTAVFNDREGSVIVLLLDAGADPEQVNHAGRTPVMLARRLGGEPTGRILRASG